MNKAKPFLFGALIGAAVVFVALQYHVVRSHDGFQFVPRTPQHSLGLAVADVRSWEADDWLDRPELARALFAHGSSDLIAQSVRQSLTEAVASDSATLDQLRQLLDQAGTNESDDQTRLIPRNGNGMATDPERHDALSIPFPSETRRPLSDPFRVAEASELNDDDRSDQPGGLTAREPVTQPFASSSRTPSFPTERNAFPEQPRNTYGSPASGLSKTQQEAAAVEQLIFGESGGSARRSAKPTFQDDSSRTRPVEPFGDVTSELESRARSALQRAQSSLSESRESITNPITTSPNRFIRDRAGDASNPSPSSTPYGSQRTQDATSRYLENFDPFIE